MERTRPLRRRAPRVGSLPASGRPRTPPLPRPRPAVLPEVVAFALVAGVTPEIAIQTSMIMSGIVTVFGGRPGMITAAAGAVAVITKRVVKDYGVAYMFYAVLLMGCYQLVVFALNGGKYAKMIPHTVMLGFVNGLAIVIAAAQVEAFKVGKVIDGSSCGPPAKDVAADAARKLTSSVDFEGPYRDWETGLWMLLVVAVTMATIVLLGLSKNKYAKAVPASFLGIVMAIVTEYAIVRPAGGRTDSIGDVAQVEGNMPEWTWSRCDMPPLTGALLGKIWLPALSMAMAGLLETALTQLLVDDITNWPTHLNREVFAQGFANTFAGCFGGMGGCAMIGQTMVNLQSGGYRRVSTLATFVLLFIINTAAYPVVNVIPISALVGVMWVVCYHTFDWASLRILFMSMPQPRRLFDRWGSGKYHKINRVDAVVVVVVTVVTVVLDLFIAVVCGVIVSCLCYAWQSGQTLKLVRVENVDRDGQLRRVYELDGPLFFGSSVRFFGFFDPRGDPNDVEVHCQEMAIMDYSGIEAIENLATRYHEQGKRLHLRFLRPACLRMTYKAKGLAATAQIEQLADEATVDSLERTGSWKIQRSASGRSVDLEEHAREQGFANFPT